MTVYVITGVFCDNPGCDQSLEGIVSDRQTSEKVRERAQKMGWITKTDDGRELDFCPNCSGRL